MTHRRKLQQLLNAAMEEDDLKRKDQYIASAMSVLISMPKTEGEILYDLIDRLTNNEFKVDLGDLLSDLTKERT